MCVEHLLIYKGSIAFPWCDYGENSVIENPYSTITFLISI